MTCRHYRGSSTSVGSSGPTCWQSTCCHTPPGTQGGSSWNRTRHLDLKLIFLDDCCDGIKTLHFLSVGGPSGQQLTTALKQLG